MVLCEPGSLIDLNFAQCHCASKALPLVQYSQILRIESEIFIPWHGSKTAHQKQHIHMIPSPKAMDQAKDLQNRPRTRRVASCQCQHISASNTVQHVFLPLIMTHDHERTNSPPLTAFEECLSYVSMFLRTRNHLLLLPLLNFTTSTKL